MLAVLNPVDVHSMTPKTMSDGHESRPSMLPLQSYVSSGLWPQDLSQGSAIDGDNRHSAASQMQHPYQSPLYDHPMKSPCFVHSHLDKGASLSDWVRQRSLVASHSDVGVAKPLQTPDQRHHHHQQHQHQHQHHASAHAQVGSPASVDDSDDHGSTLTEQLAETAVAVREMSKQLGRARVRYKIQNVLIITKARDNRLIKLTRELALYLMLKPRDSGSRGLVVYVDSQLRTSRRFDAAGIEREHPELFVPVPRRRSSSLGSHSSHSSESSPSEDRFSEAEGQLRYWTSDMCRNTPQLFDFVVTLGGDGTVLFTSWLFQRIVPPVLPFALGSLGFLTNFDFADHQAVMDSTIESGIRVNLRMRFTCTVYRAVHVKDGKGPKAVKKGETGEIMMKNVGKGGWEALEGGWTNVQEGGKSAKDKDIMCFSTRPTETFEVLNDLVVDRGPSPYVSLLELFGDEHHMTTVQADGLTVSTPTGSTAYSLSAGGSLVHPEIPSLLITPICPHTLSFRPMLLPDSMELRICVPYNSRSTAWASFDGRGRVELKQGDHIKVTASKFPFPTVCADKQSTDWFHSISRTLKWNERERQKSFVVVEEGPKEKKSRSDKHSATGKLDRPKQAGNEPLKEAVEEALNEEYEMTDDEDDKFDIDDSSPEAASNNNPENHQRKDAAIETEPTNEVASHGRRTESTSIHGKSSARVRARSKSRQRASSTSDSGSDVHSGVSSPGRYAGPKHHPPNVSPEKRLPPSLSKGNESSPDSSSSVESIPVDLARYGARDDIHSPLSAHSSGRSQIPKDRDLDEEHFSRTPTIKDPIRKGNDRGSSPDHHPRAFAVWGLDESDSAASSDSGM